MLRSLFLYASVVVIAGSVMTALGSKVANTGSNLIENRNAAIQAALDASL